MRIEVAADARAAPAVISSSLAGLPGAHRLRCLPGGEGRAYVAATTFVSGVIDPGMVDAFIRWIVEGPAEVIACGLTWRYGLDDLTPLVYLDVPPKPLGDGFPNEGRAHVPDEPCPLCGSTRWRQTADLEIAVRVAELTVAPTHDVLVPGRFRSAIAAVGALSRSVVDGDDVVQLVADGRVDLLPEAGPFLVERKCETCGVWGRCLPRLVIHGETPIGSSGVPVVFVYGQPIAAASPSSRVPHLAASRQHIGHNPAGDDPTAIGGPQVPLFISHALLSALLAAGLDDAVLRDCRPVDLRSA